MAFSPTDSIGTLTLDDHLLHHQKAGSVFLTAFRRFDSRRGHCPKVPGQGHFSESLNSGSECAFRAVAPHWPRGGQSSDMIAAAPSTESRRGRQDTQTTSRHAAGMTNTVNAQFSSTAVGLLFVFPPPVGPGTGSVRASPRTS